MEGNGWWALVSFFLRASGLGGAPVGAEFGHPGLLKSWPWRLWEADPTCSQRQSLGRPSGRWAPLKQAKRALRPSALLPFLFRLLRLFSPCFFASFIVTINPTRRQSGQLKPAPGFAGDAQVDPVSLQLCKTPACFMYAFLPKDAIWLAELEDRVEDAEGDRLITQNHLLEATYIHRLLSVEVNSTRDARPSRSESSWCTLLKPRYGLPQGKAAGVTSRLACSHQGKSIGFC